MKEGSERNGHAAQIEENYKGRMMAVTRTAAKTMQVGA
jgi:hypothetical protein